MGFSSRLFLRTGWSIPPKTKTIYRTITLTECGGPLEHTKTSKLFEGEQRYYKHYSKVLKCDMNFGIYLPPRLTQDAQPCPVLYFLNGLKGTHEDFFQKSTFGRYASELGICVASPDTSPRVGGIPEHDLVGDGATFYLDACQKPYLDHFQMYTYVTREFISVINDNFCVIRDKQGISGFSMGGYGALILHLKNPGLFQSCSAFGPVCNPMKSIIGSIFLNMLIGKDEKEWKKWDPTKLVEKYAGDPLEILLDEGTEDEYEGQTLLVRNLLQAVKENKRVRVIYKLRPGYSHDYGFVSTFVKEHLEYHAKFLNSDDCEDEEVDD